MPSKRVYWRGVAENECILAIKVSFYVLLTSNNKTSLCNQILIFFSVDKISTNKHKADEKHRSHYDHITITLRHITITLRSHYDHITITLRHITITLRSHYEYNNYGKCYKINHSFAQAVSYPCLCCIYIR